MNFMEAERIGRRMIRCLGGNIAASVSASASAEGYFRHMGIEDVSSDVRIPSSRKHSSPSILESTGILEEAVSRPSYSDAFKPGLDLAGQRRSTQSPISSCLIVMRSHSTVIRTFSPSFSVIHFEAVSLEHSKQKLIT
jgi:hypothetical protein